MRDMYGAEVPRQSYQTARNSSSASAVDTILKLLLFVIVFLGGGLSYHIAIENGLITSPAPAAEVKGAEEQKPERTLQEKSQPNF
ncbi:MAG: hypothetical protein TR69_WS6001000647 [candidate division WS6 bacterium OLB20]|uniref:Uncharacterized protein n=1 Tax=candidate division WS6 bacterium OLB20 TaxID=1617426 RepID=A0A136LY96_9BACT|nr:MAG: hypothetical protein TR69_WS6001000647 [candidate division WS6 bacterium OLB20]